MADTVVIHDKYHLGKILTEGDIATLYAGQSNSGEKSVSVLVKIARSADDNDLMEAERKGLELAHGKLNPATWGTCIPKVLDTFTTEDGRAGHILERFEGFLTGDQVRDRLEHGIDARTAVWMFKRMLILIDWLAAARITHGAILPQHVMFYPDNDGNAIKDPRKHSVRLVDWCYSRPFNRDNPTSKLKSWIPARSEFYAPEITSGFPLGPWTDLYMMAKTLVYLCKGNVAAGTFPPTFPLILASEIQEAMMAHPDARPKDLQAYHQRVTRVAEQVFGPRAWHNFVVPEEE